MTIDKMVQAAVLSCITHSLTNEKRFCSSCLFYKINENSIFSIIIKVPLNFFNQTGQYIDKISGYNSKKARYSLCLFPVVCPLFASVAAKKLKR